jgi:hypothetical protein
MEAVVATTTSVAWRAKAPSRRCHPIETATSLALPDRPSIAVLPFQNMSGDAEQELPRTAWSPKSLKQWRERRDLNPPSGVR